MPIRVEHGIPASPGLISLALAAGRQPARPSGVVRGGPAGGAGARGAGGDQVALEAFYGRQAQEQKYQQEVGMLQEQARVSAELFEYKYSAKQKQELAQINNAERLLAGPGFSDEDRAQFEPMIRAKKLGLSVPEATFRDPNKPVYEEEQDIGSIWVTENGVTMTRDTDGTPKLILRPDQTLEYLERQTELKRQEEHGKAVQEARKYWSRQEVDVPPSRPGEEVTKRRLRSDEVEERMRDELPEYRERMETAEAEAKLEELVAKRKQQEVAEVETDLKKVLDKPRKLIGWTRQMGIRKNEFETDLPEFVGMARAFMRAVQEKLQRGEDISYMSEPIMEAKIILAEYETEETSGATE